jgi:hypothetical protein
MATQESQVKTPRRSARWIWFFVILGTMLVGGVSTEIWFNVNQQLQPEQLAEARQHWREKGPRDYRLIYEVKDEVNPEPAGAVPLKYAVDVRDGKVTPVDKPSGKFVTYGSMDDLFDFVERTLQEDIARGGKRPFTVARFQKTDGHIVHYVRSVMSTRERLDIRVELTPLD